MGKLFENLFAHLEEQTAAEKSAPMKWDDFLKKTSADIDKRLIVHARKEELIYVAGKCRFTITADKTGEDVMNVDAELYYRDQFLVENNYQIYPLHTERKLSEFQMEDQETADQIAQIRQEQYEFNVELPQIKNKGVK